jgi:hypothetical protein
MNIRGFLRRIRDIFAERFDRRPIDTVDGLTRFVGTRAAYIAQTSLYGYLKTRMGTSFQRHFESDTFAPVIRTAAARLFVHCLSDLAVFAVATARVGAPMDGRDAAGLAAQCFRVALAAGLGAADRDAIPADAEAAFEARLAVTDWVRAAEGENAFAGSAAALIECAPVVDEFKALDREIVTNSIRFRWRDVREICRRRTDGAAVLADWRRTEGG